MAAVTLTPRSHGSVIAGSGVLYSSPGYAQGDEGRLIGAAEARAAECWHGPSEYVATLATGRTGSAQAPWLLTYSVVLAAGSVSSLVCGSIWGFEHAQFPLAGVTGLAAYALLAKWVRRQSSRSRVLHLAERVRRSLAYEGDSGPQRR